MPLPSSSETDQPVTLAVDVVGGDGPAHQRLQACLHFLRQHPAARVRAFITHDLPQIPAAARQHPRLQLIDCDQAIAMDEAPGRALKYGRESTLARAVADIRENSQACLSAGNTGALVAFARYFLPALPGIQKPALAAFLPTLTGRSLFLDAGASVGANSEQLLQFAQMGSAFMQSMADPAQSAERPRIALLNIGTESIKGNDTIWQANALLAESGLNYSGYCEATALFDGDHDVIVTEGFVGNVALKSAEGMARFMLAKGCWHSRIPLIGRRLKQSSRLDPGRHNGAVLLGFDGLIVKSHGACDIKSFTSALTSAWQLANQSVIIATKSHLENLL